MNEPILLSRRHYLQSMLAAGAQLGGCRCASHSCRRALLGNDDRSTYQARDLIEPVMAELVANGIAQIQSRQGCSIDLRWEGSLGNGSRHLGP